MRVGAQSMCEECATQNSGVSAILESEMVQYVMARKLKELSIAERMPERFADLPRAAWDILSAPKLFFKHVGKVRFGLSFLFALIVLLPMLAWRGMQFFQTDAGQSFVLSATQMWVASILSGLIQAVVLVLFADLILLYSARIFCIGGQNQFKFKAVANIVHFSCLPLLLALIPLPVFSYIAVGICFAYISTALRVSYQCSALQSLLCLLPFFLLLSFVS